MDKIVVIYRLLHNLKWKIDWYDFKKNPKPNENTKTFAWRSQIALNDFSGVFFLEFIHALTDHAFKILVCLTNKRRIDGITNSE